MQTIGTSCQGPLDAAFRVRLALLAPGLAAHGVELRLLPLFSAAEAPAFRGAGPAGRVRILGRARRRLRAELRAAGDRAETVVVQRQVDLVPSLALERAAARGRRLVFDVNDAIWLAGRATGGHPLGVLKGAARKVRWLAERADRTIAGNEILAEHLAAHSDSVTVVPSLVEPADYALRWHEQGEQVTLGWIGSPTTAAYLRRIVPALERFAARSPRPVRLVVVGGAAPPLSGVRVEERPWSSAAERDVLAEMDVGLMPLDDTPWSRGKCAYKALQYMAAGIPPVVNDVGVSAATVGGAGCVAADPEQWLEALETLVADPGLRARLGAAGRRRIEKDFSPRRWLPTLAAALRGD